MTAYNLINVGNFSNLPKEIFVGDIVERLDFQDQYSLYATCKVFNLIIDNEIFRNILCCKKERPDFSWPRFFPKIVEEDRRFLHLLVEVFKYKKPPKKCSLIQAGDAIQSQLLEDKSKAQEQLRNLIFYSHQHHRDLLLSKRELLVRGLITAGVPLPLIEERILGSFPWAQLQTVRVLDQAIEQKYSAKSLEIIALYSGQFLSLRDICRLVREGMSEDRLSILASYLDPETQPSEGFVHEKALLEALLNGKYSTDLILQYIQKLPQISFDMIEHVGTIAPVTLNPGDVFSQLFACFARDVQEGEELINLIQWSLKLGKQRGYSWKILKGLHTVMECLIREELVIPYTEAPYCQVPEIRDFLREMDEKFDFLPDYAEDFALKYFDVFVGNVALKELEFFIKETHFKRGLFNWHPDRVHYSEEFVLDLLGRVDVEGIQGNAVVILKSVLSRRPSLNFLNTFLDRGLCVDLELCAFAFEKKLPESVVECLFDRATEGEMGELEGVDSLLKQAQERRFSDSFIQKLKKHSKNCCIVM